MAQSIRGDDEAAITNVYETRTGGFMIAESNIHAAALAGVQEEIAALEAKLAEAKAVAGYHAARIEKPMAKDSIIHGPARTPRSTAAKTEGPQDIGSMKQFELAAAVLKKVGAPMKTGAIADAMLEMGFKHDDAAKLKIALYTAMNRRNDLFERLGDGMWKLKEQTT